MVVATSLLIMGFAFQKFVPEFALYRSINANAARIRNTADGSHLPVVYFEWQCDGSSFYLPTDQICRFNEHDLDGMRRFVATHPEAVVITDPHQIDKLQETLGSQATFSAAAVLEDDSTCCPHGRRLMCWGPAATPRSSANWQDAIRKPGC